MREELTRCQSLADELAVQSLFGANLLETVCLLKMQCDAFCSADSAATKALQLFVCDATEQIFELCKQTYCTMYLRVYAMLGKAPPLSSQQQQQPAKLKTSGVVIDPSSALNIVQWEAHMKVTLYNDNETLFKFAPSELAALDGVEEKTADLERYYSEQCDAVQAYYAQYRALITQSAQLTLRGLQVAHQATQVKECLRLIGGDDDDDTTTQPLSVALDQLIATTEGVYLARRQQVAYCQRMVDNCSAKFNCCARLKDNMLRPYYLSRAHRCGTLVAALF